MKRLLTLVLSLLLCCALFVPAAHADVVWEPIGNSFYDAHRDECVYRDKAYAVFDEVPVYDAPGDSMSKWSVSAGENVYVGFVYTDADGVEWGATDTRQGEDWISGWIDLRLLSPVYDTRDFLADHAAEVQPYAGEPAELTGEGEWMLWSYPGSETGYPFQPDDSFAWKDWAGYVYTDETGAQWVNFPYVYGDEGWVYVPDPCRTEPVSLAAATPAPTMQPAQTAQPTQSAQATPAASHSAALILICVGVALVVMVSAVLIVILYVVKKK